MIVIMASNVNFVIPNILVGLNVTMSFWAELFEAWLALTSIKYHGNLLILMQLNRWLALTMLRTTGPWQQKFYDVRYNIIIIIGG